MCTINADIKKALTEMAPEEKQNHIHNVLGLPADIGIGPATQESNVIAEAGAKARTQHPQQAPIRGEHSRNSCNDNNNSTIISYDSR